MGWRRGFRAAEEVAFFQCGGLILSLYHRTALAADAGLPFAAGEGFSSIVLAHNTRDRAGVDAVLAEASRAGGRIAKPAQETFWGGYAGCFADPDGHFWEIAGIPAFPWPPMAASACRPDRAVSPRRC